MFERRSYEAELLDVNDTDESLAMDGYRFMAVVNKYFGGTAIAKDFIANEIKLQNKTWPRCASGHATQPLKILDIGSGSCDIPAAVCGWAQKAGVNIEYTCVEPSDFAAKAARPNVSRYPNIKLVQEDIFNYRTGEKFDCATGSLFFHHLRDEQIIELLARLREMGCKSVLINDLHRSLSCYAGCLVASAFIRADVRHDALLSIRRAFKPDELRRLVEEDTAEGGCATRFFVRKAWFGRVYAVVRFDMEDKK